MERKDGDTDKPIRISQLVLRNWRNFSQVDVQLGRRVFLLGPNASGKSNLLDAIRFLHDIVAVGGGFRDAVSKRQGVKQLRCLAARKSSDIQIEVRMKGSKPSSDWRYSIAFTQDNLRRPVLRSEVVERNGKILISRPDEGDSVDQERLTQTYLEQVHANQPFREIADFFASIRYLHLVSQLVREPDRSVGRVADPYGGDFLDQIAATNSRTQTSRLRRIRDALKVAVPQLLELELHRDNRGIPHLRGRFEHWRPQGAWQAEDQFSDGTLRLLGLLWSLLDGGGPLLLEEPELSLHQEVVEKIARIFERIQRKSKRQIFVSTHSEALLRDKSISLDEVFFLEPDPEGTKIKAASQDAQIRALVNSGMTVGESTLPKTRPAEINQLDLFGN